jgi:putative NADH-flavin reductase
MQKSIAVIGASAGIGLECVGLALRSGYQVIAMARNTSALAARPNLRLMNGDATNANDLKEVIRDADAVIVALGTGMDRKPTALYTNFAQALMSLSADLKQKPVQLVTGFGAGDSASYQGFFAKLLFRLLLKAVYENKSAMEALIENSSLNWSFVRPGLLTNAKTLRPALVQIKYRKGMKVGAVSRTAVARFLVEMAANPRWQRSKPALSAS